MEIIEKPVTWQLIRAGMVRPADVICAVNGLVERAEKADSAGELPASFWARVLDEAGRVAWTDEGSRSVVVGMEYPGAERQLTLHPHDYVLVGRYR